MHRRTGGRAHSSPAPAAAAPAFDRQGKSGVGAPLAVPAPSLGAAILTGNELFWRLTTKHYWKSGSSVPDIPHRGYQLIQSIIRNDKIDGVTIDRNLTKNDNFGGSVQWLSAS